MSVARRWQVLAGILLLFAAAGVFLRPTELLAERRPFDSFPREVAGYRGRHVPVSNEALRQLDLSDYLSRTYERDGRAINVYVGFHASQRRSSIIHSPQECLPAAGWYIVSRDRVPLAGGPPTALVNRMEAAYGRHRELVYYWYQGRGRIVADEYVAALYRALDAGLRSRTDEALVRFSTPYDGEEAEAALLEFMREFRSHLPPYVPA